MIIDVIDGFQVRCLDKMNWQVYERCEVKKRGEDKTYTGETAEEWVALPSYHRSVGDAVLWIAGYIPKARYRKFKGTLDDFLKAMDDVAARIERSAKKINKAVRK